MGTTRQQQAPNANQSETTGTLVAWAENMGTRVYAGLDNGSYGGCNPTLNVRRVSSLARVPVLGWRAAGSAEWVAIVARGQGYGGCWTGDSALHPVSLADLDQLRAIHNAAEAATAAREAQEDAYADYLLSIRDAAGRQVFGADGGAERRLLSH